LLLYTRRHPHILSIAPPTGNNKPRACAHQAHSCGRHDAALERSRSLGRDPRWPGCACACEQAQQQVRSWLIVLMSLLVLRPHVGRRPGPRTAGRNAFVRGPVYFQRGCSLAQEKEVTQSLDGCCPRPVGPGGRGGMGQQRPQHLCRRPGRSVLPKGVAVHGSQVYVSGPARLGTAGPVSATERRSTLEKKGGACSGLRAQRPSPRSARVK
jgi:hypothetical protein